MAKEPKQKEANVEKQEGGGGTTETYKYTASPSAQLKTLEEELFDLVQLSEVPLDKELFKDILELLKVNVAPAAILQVLSTLSSLENGSHSATPTEERSTASTKEPIQLEDDQPDTTSDRTIKAQPPPAGTTRATPQPTKGTQGKHQAKTSKLKRPMS